LRLKNYCLTYHQYLYHHILKPQLVELVHSDPIGRVMLILHPLNKQRRSEGMILHFGIGLEEELRIREEPREKPPLQKPVNEKKRNGSRLPPENTPRNQPMKESFKN
jgi:hypothetical protein